MATVLSDLDWFQEPLRVDLAEIMDELDPGWSAWRAGDDRMGRDG
jgi:hypothetical protein